MAFNQHGATKYVFAFAKEGSTTAAEATAIETATGIAPAELVISGEPEFVAEAEGGSGQVEAVAVADDVKLFTLSGNVTDVDKATGSGLTFSHDGRYYIITGNNLTKNAKQFQKAQLSGKSWPGISAPAGP